MKRQSDLSAAMVAEELRGGVLPESRACDRRVTHGIITVALKVTSDKLCLRPKGWKSVRTVARSKE